MTPDTSPIFPGPQESADDGSGQTEADSRPEEMTHLQMEQVLGKKLPAKVELIGLNGCMYQRDGKVWYLLSSKPVRAG